MPSIGALFAGYGGLELGLSVAVPDAHLAWVAENDPGMSTVLARRFPGVPNLGDVTTLWDRLFDEPEEVDILTGGVPCQDLSHAGRMAGMTEGTRSNLWVRMREAVDRLRPRLVVWENVRGSLSASADSALEVCPRCMGDHRPEPTLRALGRVLGDLADLGYDAAWTVVRASDVGAPHERRRVFLLAWPDSAPPDARGETRIERTGLRPTSPPGLGRRFAARGDRPHDRPSDLELLPTPAVNDMGENKTVEWWDEWAPRQRSAAGAPAPHGRSLAIETLRGFGRYEPAIRRWELELGRPAPEPTEPTGRSEAERLSPRFVEWLMGLPSGWVTDVPGLSRNAQLRALGNGVVPQQAAAAISYLLDVREQTLAATA